MSTLHPIQQSRLSRFGVTQCIDIHCHILPGVDDGPANLDETLTLARSLMRDGITTVIATPHQLGRYDGQNPSRDVRVKVAELQTNLDSKNIPLRLIPGAEVRLDERLPKFLTDDRILTLADGRKFLLLELPSSVAIDPGMVMPMFRGTGVTVVLAHAERCGNLQADPDSAQAWLDVGAVLQVNAGGLINDFGAGASNAAWQWMERGWVSLIATDAHSIGTRRPRMTDAIDAIAGRLGEEMARCVCIENPIRVCEGKELQKPMATP